MNVNQIYKIMNTISKELLGDTAVVNEDLSNIVELGNTFENVVGLDNYVKALNDHIGRMVFVDRVYKGRAPSVLMDGWEYGSIMEKVSAVMPEATENESWELTNGASYDGQIFYKPTVIVKCWNNRVTFEIPISITEVQVKSSFTTVTQLNSFLSMIRTAIENSMTTKLDALIMRTINNFTAETLFNEYNSGDTFTGASHAKAVNLLYLYNTNINTGTAITSEQALTNIDFIKFASATMANYVDRIKTMSTLFNIGEQPRFTPDDMLHVVMLSQFKNSADVYLQSDTFHNEFTAFPKSESVPYWQGSGENYEFSSTSKIDIKTSGNHTVTATGVLAVMFDRDALGVTCINPRVTSQFVAKGEFFNEWHKYDAGYFNDTNENFVVFFVA